MPGILHRKNAQVVDSALSKADKYEILAPIKLVARDFGVPTSRERVFFFGYLRDQMNSLTNSEFATENPTRVHVKEALEGLPKRIDPSWIREEDGWRRVDKDVDGIFGVKLREQIPDRVGNIDAIARLREKKEVSGCLGTRHSERVLERYIKVKQGEVDSISRSRRLEPDGFCPTLRAGTGSDKGSYQAVRPLHPTENRVITPREAARMQGFPDWFQFHPTKWHSFRQIGNSVSPILAEHLLRVIKESF